MPVEIGLSFPSALSLGEVFRFPLQRRANKSRILSFPPENYFIIPGAFLPPSRVAASETFIVQSKIFKLFRNEEAAKRGGSGGRVGERWLKPDKVGFGGEGGGELTSGLQR